MKASIIALVLFLGVSFSAMAQNKPKMEQKEYQKTEMKAHVCTAACTNGNHMYAHGEKGHICTAACKTGKAGTEEMSLKEHKCTSACKGGKHIYVHGEKGHICSAACKS